MFGGENGLIAPIPRRSPGEGVRIGAAAEVIGPPGGNRKRLWQRHGDRTVDTAAYSSATDGVSPLHRDESKPTFR